jgi:hypothetical protein
MQASDPQVSRVCTFVLENGKASDLSSKLSMSRIWILCTFVLEKRVKWGTFVLVQRVTWKRQILGLAKQTHEFLELFFDFLTNVHTTALAGSSSGVSVCMFVLVKQVN